MYVRKVTIKCGRTRITAFDPITEAPPYYTCARMIRNVGRFLCFILPLASWVFRLVLQNDSIGGRLNHPKRFVFLLLLLYLQPWRSPCSPPRGRGGGRTRRNRCARRIIEFGAPTSSAAAAVDKKLNGYVLNLGLET